MLVVNILRLGPRLVLNILVFVDDLGLLWGTCFDSL